MEISLSDPKSGIHQKDIASHQEISFKYLDPIIASLKAANLIANVGGKKSGYKLTYKPADINMLHIYEAFESNLHINDCLGDDFDCLRREKCPVYDFWDDLNNLIVDHLKLTSLEDIQKKHMELTE